MYFLITVISIKGEIDKDYVNYLYLFENSSKFQGNLSLKDFINRRTGLEIGFNILNRLIKTLELNVQYIWILFTAMLYIKYVITLNRQINYWYS